MFQAFKTSLLVVGLMTLGISSLHARVTRIVIDEVRAVPAATGGAGAIAYEQVAGRAFGELDPKLAQNAIIQDIDWPRMLTAK